MFIRAVILSAVLFAILGVIYVLLDSYLRWDTIRQLERRYAAGEGGGVNREDFIEKGLATYERSTEKKVLMG
ncbi:MAG: hypothetical protein AAGF76_00855, partial [Pseudomonadota bacterium]